MVLRMDNGPEFISLVLPQFYRNSVGISYITPGTPPNNGHIESGGTSLCGIHNRLRKAIFGQEWLRD